MKKTVCDVTTQNDHALVQAAQNGDQTAFTALYNRYFSALYRFCYWQTNKSADAEDIVQDVMLIVLRSLKHFRFSASFRNYLYAIAKRRIALWLQQKYKLPTVQYEAFLHEIGDDDSWLDEENQKQKRRSLLQLLRNLPIREQKILRLRYLQGLSQAEVAKKLHLTVANIKVLCHRSLKKLSLTQKNRL